MTFPRNSGHTEAFVALGLLRFLRKLAMTILCLLLADDFFDPHELHLV